MSKTISELDKLINETKPTTKELEAFVKISNFLVASFLIADVSDEQRAFHCSTLESHKNIATGLLKDVNNS